MTSNVLVTVATPFIQSLTLSVWFLLTTLSVFFAHLAQSLLQLKLIWLQASPQLFSPPRRSFADVIYPNSGRWRRQQNKLDLEAVLSTTTTTPEMHILLRHLRPALQPLRAGFEPLARRGVIATSHQTHTEDEVFVSRLSESHRQGIVVLNFNRPHARNSLSRNMAKLLMNNMEQLMKDPEIRILIIRSVVPNVFCAGADLKERLNMSEVEIPPFVARLRWIANAIHDFPLPTIAAVDGAAIGGGLEYALSADMRVVSDNAKLGLVETKLAVIPGAGGTQRLSRILPIHLAKELIFTGRLVDGRQAHQMGMANYVVEQNQEGDAAYKKALEIAEEILPGGPIALKNAKYAINKGIEVDLNSGLAIEAACHTLCVHTKDRIEGLVSFKEKRLPKYKGQ